MGSRAIKGRHGIKKKNGKVIALSILGVFVAVIAAGVIGVSALCASWLQDLPDYTNADAYYTSEPSVLYAQNSETGEQVVLAEFQLENRTPVEWDDISDYVLEGTVATEDERFYSHNGVDLMGIARALVNNLMGGDLEGASTITQQFVRNTILSGEMTDISIKRKVREMYIALKLEDQFSKDEILLMYLNTINYGSGAYGIEAASERYFSKHADELTLAEAATLIGIPQSPTYNDPTLYPDNAVERRNTVLDRMLSNGVITQEEADAAKAEPLVLNETIPSNDGIKAYPYFTSYVRDQLLSADGYAFSEAEIFEGGLEIYTTLDVAAQQDAEEAAQNKLDEVGDKFEVALVAIDPDNGQIKAMIGGKDFDTNQVNMATGSGGSKRQVGSSFKTFTLVTSIEEGIDPQTMIDAGATVEVPGSEDVHNYGYTDYGTRSIASAFAVSSNTAFIRLILSVGVDKVIDVSHRLGIQSDLEEIAGITLGTCELSPLEMSSAYATIANGGTYYEPECVARIVDRSGNVIYDSSNPEGERAISEEVACAAIDVMKGVITSGTGTAARLSNGQEAAGKTGTTETNQDSWFCGITPQYSVAIWLGERTEYYIDASAVPGTAASVFSDFLNSTLADQPIEEFPTAAEPDYKTYTDEKYHIGGYYSSSSGRNNGSGSGGGTSGSGTNNPGGGTGTNTGGGGSPGTNTGGGTDTGGGGGGIDSPGGDTGGGTDTGGGGGGTDSPGGADGGGSGDPTAQAA